MIKKDINQNDILSSEFLNIIDYNYIFNNKPINRIVTKPTLENTLAKLENLKKRILEIRDCNLKKNASKIVYSDGDPVEQAKVLSEEAAKIENLKILSGILVEDGKTSILDSSQVEALSKLPSREELIVKLLFLLQAPATQFVLTLNAVPVKFVRTLAAIRDSKN